jgi:hypothetical protein
MPTRATNAPIEVGSLWVEMPTACVRRVSHVWLPFLPGPEI